MPGSAQNIHIDMQPLGNWVSQGICPVDIMRLDRIHSVISGNKWFKLQYYLAEAKASSTNTLASFGGPYSNHIIALACAGRDNGLHTVGFIRGEMPARLSHTLLQARTLGMELVFTDRKAYLEPEKIIRAYDQPGWQWVPEGGYGTTGARGAAEILSVVPTGNYTHIICAVGTGTMLAGLINRAQEHQHLTGISVMKGNRSLEQSVAALLDPLPARRKNYTLLHDYHFGGYGRHPEPLLQFMRDCWQQEQLPTDIVYTSKMLFAVKDLLSMGYFPAGSRLLLIHSGGLQGNGSLPPHTLPF